jgi:hypothetical protein
VNIIPLCEKVIFNGMDDSSLTNEKIEQLIKNYDTSLLLVKPKNHHLSFG